MIQRNVLSLLILISVVFHCASGQDYVPKAEFLDDTLKIGMPVRFAMSIEYPGEWQIYFPDSADSYGSFEFYGKRTFPTFSRDSLAVDSVIYELQSFELDSVQGLALPVFRLHRGDTTELLSNSDSISLLEYIEVVPEELDLKENALLRFIPDIFNKKLFLILAGIVLVLMILVIVLFGKKILVRWRIYQMERRHKKFLLNFDGIIDKSRSAASKELIESSSARWKDYLTELENKPYNTFSTRDFLKHMDSPELIENLRKIDAYVYGGSSDDKITDPLIVLKHFAEDRFEQRKKEVKDA